MERNWAGNVGYHAARIHRPASVPELQELVRGSTRIRALGSRHSFSDLADTTGDLVALGGLPRVLELDASARTVTIDGALRYGDLCGPLDIAGFALHNLASLPHISVAGACATATHGSGLRLGNLATAVEALELVTADGELARLRRGDEAFPGAVVGLGALGVITSLTLRVEPTYQVRQDVYEHLPRATAVERFEEIMALGDSVSLFTTWSSDSIEELWIKRRVEGAAFEPPAEVFGATRATAPVHPVPGMPTEACTDQLGVPGPWHERLPHFRMAFTPSAGDEVQSEYLLPLRHAGEALAAIGSIARLVAPLTQTSEVRTVAEDDLWLSSSYGGPAVGIHFTWVPDEAAVRDVLPAVERALEPFEPRPHWGKVSTLPGHEVRARYPRMDAFAALARRLDPESVFRNAFVDRYVS